MSVSAGGDTATTTAATTEFGVKWLTRDKVKRHLIVSVASVFNVKSVQPAMFGHDFRQGLAATSKDSPKPTHEMAFASAGTKIDPNEEAPGSHDYGACLLEDFVIVDGDAYALLTVERGHERKCRVYKVVSYKDTGEIARNTDGTPRGGWVTESEQVLLVPVGDLTPLPNHRLSGERVSIDSKLAKENAHLKKNARDAKRLTGGDKSRPTSRKRLSPSERAALLAG
jgi:hypothetical protein